MMVGWFGALLGRAGDFLRVLLWVAVGCILAVLLAIFLYVATNVEKAGSPRPSPSLLALLDAL